MKNIIENKLVYNLDNIVEKRPLTADIFLTNYCNNRCPYCSYSRYDERRTAGEYMNFEEFKMYAEKLIKLGVKGFILTGGGEPTINRDFDKITRYLEENGIKYGINTNFNKLKLIRPEYLKVSLDAWSNESYKEKRGVEKYEQAIENIKKYREWQKKENVKTNLGIQALVKTKEDVEKFYEANKYLDVDYIVFRPVESKQGEYYKSDSAKEEIIRMLEELAKKDERINVNYKWYRTDVRFEKCYAQANQIALNWKGDVLYCCHKPYEIVGHILDDDILEKKEKFKTNINMCDIPCRMTGANMFIKELEKGCKNSEFI